MRGLSRKLPGDRDLYSIQSSATIVALGQKRIVETTDSVCLAPRNIDWPRCDRVEVHSVTGIAVPRLGWV